jgi:NADH dehydrogenase FAD-containing subunit
VLAAGTRHSDFGNEAWEPFAPGLKKIEDATDVRHHILMAFGKAENTEDADKRKALVTFCVVGGGPTGVETAGAIAELSRHGMGGKFRNADPADASVILVQSADRLLPSFPETLSARTQESLERIGVEVMTGARVTDINATGIAVGHERIAARTVVWAAGVIASAAGRWLDTDRDRAGRTIAEPDLTIKGANNIFIVGDTAASDGWAGQPVPGLAPAAKQGGNYAARVIGADLAKKQRPGPFRYKHPGSLATIGRSAATADFGRLKLHGAPAWWIWSMIHVLFLASARNRLSVSIEWMRAYQTFRRSTRLITGD